MPNISRINKQLEMVASRIENFLSIDQDTVRVDLEERISVVLERLTKAQKALVETQVLIFIEATESDLDMPVLPLFVEERDSNEGWGAPE